mmetsp:Transcript_9758/g.44464  ORF Transcript_9758/g.44464 Transcript_9758/m.44464 type:complete len:230 (-) Transcript_9758:416-1105(-)
MHGGPRRWHVRYHRVHRPPRAQGSRRQDRLLHAQRRPLLHLPLHRPVRVPLQRHSGVCQRCHPGLRRSAPRPPGLRGDPRAPLPLHSARPHALHLQLGLARVRRRRQQEHGRSHARPLRRHRAGYHPRRAHRVGHRSQVRGGDHLLHRLRVPFPLRHRVLPQRSRLLLRSVGPRAPDPRRLRRRLRRQQGIRNPRGGLQRLALVHRLLHGRLLLRPPHPLPEGQQVHQV